MYSKICLKHWSSLLVSGAPIMSAIFNLKPLPSVVWLVWLLPNSVNRVRPLQFPKSQNSRHLGTNTLYKLSFCFRNTLSQPPQSHRSGSFYRRYCMLALLLVLGVTVLLLILSRLGRYSTENDPNLDPKNNPNLRVHEQHSM